MRVDLLYGKGILPLDVPTERVSVLRPRAAPPLSDERAAFEQAVQRPMGSWPLRSVVSSSDVVAVVIPDITRPLPRERLLPWLFAEISHVPDDHIVIVNGTGSHRSNTPEEIERMVGREIARRYRVVNHNAHDPQTLALAGCARDGRRVYMNRSYVEADRRIVLGFIEPHFMAGFSGGYKGVCPAVVDIDTILHYHGAAQIGDPRSTWLELEENPTQRMLREYGGLLPVDFLINVTQDAQRRITGFFCGEVLASHREGCRFSSQHATQACPERFPIVVTTNNGYPLDQNLYQAVKGMSAAARIATDGGMIIAAARCEDGFPDHGNFRQLLFRYATPRAMLEAIESPGFCVFDQWEAQMLGMILARHRIGLFSDLSPDAVRRAHLEPIADIRRAIEEEIKRIGRDATVAVLPEGFAVVPCLEARTTG
jgi:nickel-dependent lactate racemase